MTLIRTAINESTETTYTDDEISDTYDAFNENVKQAIAHFLLAQAEALTYPTAPTAPTLDSAPTLSTSLWAEKSRQDLDLFSRELQLYQDELAVVRQKAEIKREQARVWMGSTEKGYVL